MITLDRPKHTWRGFFFEPLVFIASSIVVGVIALPSQCELETDFSLLSGLHKYIVHYSEAVRPMQAALHVIALALFALVYLNRGWVRRTLALILSGLWLWSGSIYHWIFLTDINVLAWIFGRLMRMYWHCMKTNITGLARLIFYST